MPTSAPLGTFVDLEVRENVKATGPMFTPSVTACHALRTLVVLAIEPGRWHRVDELIDRASVPRPFLSKLLHRLGAKRVVRSRRGRRGGYRLAVEPQRFSLLDVIRAVDGDDALHRCQLGTHRCSARGNCPMHPYWSEERQRLLRKYSELTLERLAGQEFLYLDGDSSVRSECRA